MAMLKLLKKAGSGVLIVFAMIFGSGLAKVAANYITDSMSDSHNKTAHKVQNEDLPRIASKINESLPMMVDQVTQLNSIAASSMYRRLEYMYTIFGDIETKGLIDQVRPSITKSVCTDEKTSYLLKDDIEIVYSYYKDDGEYIGRFTVVNSNCQ